MDNQDIPAVVIKDIYKTFKLPHEQYSGVKQVVLNLFRTNKGFERQKVLNDISFEIKKGEFFGIVGRNGSGKSTLLKLLAGIYVPDKGLIQVNGSLTPFIELGVGFNPELTGRENVYMNGALLGFDHEQMDKMYNDIVGFAELEKFMDQKLKNYSSGMQVRLAFSIAIRAKSDILLLDEVLAVGDAVFQKKCYDYFKQLKKENKTVIFVSHDTSALQEYCDRGVLIEKGNLLKIDKIDRVIDDYVAILNDDESHAIEQNNPNAKHIGKGDIITSKLEFANGKNGLFTGADEMIEIKATYDCKGDVEEPIYGITITDAAGERVFVGNNMWSNKKMPDVKTGEKVHVAWSIPNVFNSGTYNITPAVAANNGTVMLDQTDDMLRFKIRKRQISNTYVNVEYGIKILPK